MATKKKARKVSTVFGNQKVSTSPEVASKIKSGEISPSSHTFAKKDGEVIFAPRRRATVGGQGIMPSMSANTGAKMPSARANMGVQMPSMSANTGAKMPSARANMGVPMPSASANNTPSKRVKSPSASQVNNDTPQSYTPPSNPVPSANTDAMNGTTPAHNMQMNEQQAARIAPFKADLDGLSAQLSELQNSIINATSQEELAGISAKIQALKGALNPAQ